MKIRVLLFWMMTIVQFIRSAKVSNSYFIVAILTYAMLNLSLHLLSKSIANNDNVAFVKVTSHL